tara:strand:+ start:551 stop:1987 length:1437 start_codon:yes stop_codon:yes gene_type:complete
MAVDVKLKRSHTHSTIPTTSNLVEGEFAVNTYDKKLYMRDGSNNIVAIANEYATDFDSATKVLYVTVASSTSDHPYHGTGSSNKYKINGVFSPYLHLIPKNTYKFDQSDSSNSGHPLRFYLDAAKATAFTTGVTTSGTPGNAGAYTQIVVSDTTPSVLHYQCSAHGNMGWAAFTNTRNLTNFDTDDLSEGSSNLYHTTARVNSAIDSRVNASFVNGLTIVADTATALASARNIGGVSFNGTADINLPGVNAGGNQDTSGNAATATTLASSRNIHGVAFNGSADIDLSEVIQDTVGAMFTSNTETNITATYQDLDGTIDLVVSASGIASLADDSSPQLGGNLDVVTHGIVSTSNRNIAITPNGSGKVILDGLSHPVADGNAGQVLKTDGSGNLGFASVSSLAGAGIQNVSDDSSPQLGGNLDVVTHSIVSASNRNISILPNGSGKVVVGTNGIQFGDGTIQTTAGSTQGFAIAMGVALG